MNYKIMKLVSMSNNAIVEYFSKDESDYTPKVYELTNLTMDKENGIVFCCDGDDKLCLKYGLFAFPMDDVIYVGFQEWCKVVTISFDYGYVRICY